MAAMPWLRLYSCAATDPKLRLVSAESRHPFASVLAVWVSMLCHAGSLDGEERGTLSGWLDAASAAQLDLPTSTVADIRHSMAGLLLDGQRVIAWSKRQGVRAAGPRGEGSQGGTPAAERMRAMRARRAGVTGVTPVTAGVTGGVTGVTAVTDRGEERREEQNHPSVGSSSCEGGGAGEEAPPRPREPELPLPRVVVGETPEAAPRALHRLPASWMPDDSLLAFAAGLGVDGTAAAGAFADYWQAEGGSRARKRDWNAAFRTWCRREAEHAANARAAPRLRAPAERTGPESFAERDARQRRDGLSMLQALCGATVCSDEDQGVQR